MKETKSGPFKKMKDSLGINIIISMIGIFVGIMAFVFNLGILAKLAIMILGISAIIDGKGNVRF